MLEDAKKHVVREVVVRGRPRERTATYWRLLGLLTAAGVGTVFWVSILMLVSHAFALEVSAGATIGVSLVVASLTFVVAAIVTEGSHSDQGQAFTLVEAEEEPASSNATEEVRPPPTLVSDWRVGRDGGRAQER